MMDFEVESTDLDLRHALNTQRKQNAFCDVNLRVDCEVFPTHRCILAANSEHFRRLFLDTEVSRVYKLPPGPTYAYALILDYMYLGKIHITLSNVDDILKVAELLGIDEVKNFCSDILRRHLDITNCIHVKSLIDRFSLNDIRQDVLDFLSPKMADLLTGYQLQDTPFEELYALLSDRELSHTKESDLLMFIIRWVNTDPEQRKLHMNELVSLVNFSYLSPDFVKRHIINKDAFMDAMSPSQRKVVELKSSEASYPGRTEDVLFCLSVPAPDQNQPALLVYKIAEDTWHDIERPPNGVKLECVESLTSHQGSLYILLNVVRSREIINDNMVKEVWRLDMTRGTWTQMPAPEQSTQQSHLVSHDRGLLIIDGSGVIEKYDNMSETWVNYSGLTFEGEARCVLPKSMERYVYLLRSLDDGTGGYGSSRHMQLQRYDTNKYSWDAAHHIDTDDLGEHERFLGYEVTPANLTLKDALGFPRLQYDFASKTSTTIIPNTAVPSFVTETRMSVEHLDRVYFAGSSVTQLPSFMFYDHEGERFKAVTSPSVCISKVICHAVAPRALGKVMANNTCK